MINHVSTTALAVALTVSVACAQSGVTQRPTLKANQAGKAQIYHDRAKMIERLAAASQTQSGGDVRPVWQRSMSAVVSMRDRVPVTAPRWKNVGPNPLLHPDGGLVGGACIDLAIDPRGATDTVMYLASVNGGIWKTVDGGATWTPKTDSMPCLSMGAVAVDPSNPDVVFAGTGSFFDGAGFFSKFIGIYKSTNGGGNWRIIGPDRFQPGGPAIRNVMRMLAAPDALYVGTNVGLYRSTDGGENFVRVRENWVTDIMKDTANSDIYVADSDGISRSTNGTTFTSIFTRSNSSPDNFEQIVFAQSTYPDNKTIYAATTSGGAYVGVYRSDDRGAHWSKASGSNLGGASDSSNQGFYDLAIAVEPSNARRLYLGLTQSHVSNDGGQTFPELISGTVHADQHRIVASPRTHLAHDAATNPNATANVYLINDGGIWLSTSRTAYSPVNNGLCAFLTTGLTGGRSKPTTMYGAFWDNGAAYHNSDMRGDTWNTATSGDGGMASGHPINANIAYIAGNYDVIRTGDGGRSWTNPYPFQASVLGFVVDSSDSAPTIAAGFNHVYVNGNPLPNLRKDVASIATTPADKDSIWASLMDGSVWMSTVRGAPWKLVRESFPRRPATVVVNPRNASDICVVFTGYNEVSMDHPTLHVVLTHDGGRTWRDISGVEGHPETNLPDIPVYDAVFDNSRSPARIFVGTEGGVFATQDEGAHWAPYGRFLPTVPCKTLKYYEPQGGPGTNPLDKPLLRVGTWGRGVWECQLD